MDLVYGRLLSPAESNPEDDPDGGKPQASWWKERYWSEG